MPFRKGCLLMLVKQLSALLKQTGTSLRSVQADAEPDLGMLIAALEQNGDRPLADLVKLVSKPWPKPAAPKQKTPPVFDVSSWVGDLRRAQSDASAFQALLDVLAKSKQLKTAEVAAVANHFRGTTKAYKTKAAAVGDVRKAWMEGLRDADKVKKAGGIF
jgi:hypothetical protein